MGAGKPQHICGQPPSVKPLFRCMETLLIYQISSCKERQLYFPSPDIIIVNNFISTCNCLFVLLLVDIILMVHHNAENNKSEVQSSFWKTLEGASQCKGCNTDRGIDSSSLLLTQPAYIRGVNVKWLLTSHFGHWCPMSLTKCFTIMSISVLMWSFSQYLDL